jgi:hypothetical protein
VQPQLSALRDRIGTRPIDALIINVGANDIGFGSILRLCTVPNAALSTPLFLGSGFEPASDCYDDQHMVWKPDEDGGSYVQDATDPRATTLAKAVKQQIARLSSAYDRLASALGALHFSSTPTGKLPIYIDEYYNPAPIQDGTCTSNGGTGALHQAELRWLNYNVLPGLNDAVAHTTTYGWNVVHDVNDFDGHGMCAANGKRWVNTLADVTGTGSQDDIWGVGHPNTPGYHDIAGQELADILPNLPSP